MKRQERDPLAPPSLRSGDDARGRPVSPVNTNCAQRIACGDVGGCIACGDVGGCIACGMLAVVLHAGMLAVVLHAGMLAVVLHAGETGSRPYFSCSSMYAARSRGCGCVLIHVAASTSMA